MTFNLFLSVILTLALSVYIQAKTQPLNNTIYIISNAETPSLELPGLTPIGARRAQECLPTVFAPLNVGLVITCPFDPASGKCGTTIVTATPVANSLGLPVNTTCGADEETDDDCVTNLMMTFAMTSTKSILIVWDLGDLDSLYENLNVDDSGIDSDDDTPHYDVLSTVVGTEVTSNISQGCPGIDGQAPGTFRRRSSSRALKRRSILSGIVG